MRLGATLVHLSDAPPYEVAPWARRLVDAGFESLWTPHIVGRGRLVPDPFTTLAVAAAATAVGRGSEPSGIREGVELGTATVQLPLLHPVDVAHRVLSLVAQCGDRVTLGVSPGSSRADYDALDADYGGRFAAFRPRAERLRELLTRGRDEGAVLGAAPARRPPLLIGSWGANVERAARHFDGWLASGYRTTPDEIVAAHERFRAAGGRRAIVCAVPVEPGCDLGALGRTLRRYDSAGFDDAVMLIAPGGPAPEEVRECLA